MSKKRSKSRPENGHERDLDRPNGDESEEREIVPSRLDELHLDPKNPRFGGMAGRLRNEVQILDFIVDQFGVQDVLSSIAVNGYFNSEPILAKRDADGTLIVAEGNRRLVACLILAGDARAKNQSRRARDFRKIHEDHGAKQYAPVPTIIFETKEDIESLLPYLGVRHIAGAQEWDSYAKAAWVAQAIEGKNIELDDVIGMIGDETRLAKRMLAGYYVARQVIEGGHFSPEESEKKGTKSCPDYPFSWVYTALGYSSIATWVRLPEDPRKNPLDKTGLERAGNLFTWMFGQKDVARAVVESREIGELARSISDPQRLRLLRSGLTVRAVMSKTRPAATQVSDGLTKCHEQLHAIVGLLAEGSVTSGDATDCLPLSLKVRRLSQRVHHELESAADASEDTDA